jgi:uncharacterized CHY-type Zn-finger protein
MRLFNEFFSPFRCHGSLLEHMKLAGREHRQNDDEYLAEITRKKLLLRKPFSAKQLVEFIDSHFNENGRRAP